MKASSKYFDVDWKEAGCSKRDAIAFERLSRSARAALCASRDASGYTDPHDFVRLPDDASILKDVTAMAKKFRSTALRDVVVVGIGGSSLGARAVYDALKAPSPRVVMHFLDTTDPVALTSVQQRLHAHSSPKRFVVCIVSQSGTTTETIANAAVLLDGLKHKFKSVEDRCVAITDEGSPLWTFAARHNMSHLAIQRSVGGRFSVLTPVGLFPLLLCDIDVMSFIQGAKEATRDALSARVSNPAMMHGAALFSASRAGRTLYNAFIFHSALVSLGMWLRQLMGESLGKQFDTSGKQVRAGIVPLVSAGTTDLHSVAQLYFGGPRNIFTDVISAPFMHDVCVPSSSLAKLSAGASRKTFWEILAAILEGVLDAYKQNKQRVCDIRFRAVGAHAIGYFMQSRMIETVYLAAAFGVNPFDQPNVEDYKRVTKRRLTRQDS